MASADETLSLFIDAWNAGERPSVHDYLTRVDGAERDELAGLIEAFLEWAPAPPYSPEQREQIASEPAVRATIELVGAPSTWAVLLPTLRERARITRQEVVGRLADMLGVGAKQARVEVYYHRMETGLLEPSGVSQRVLDALAGIFGVSADEIAAAGDFSPPSVAFDAMHFRADAQLVAPPAESLGAPVMADSRPNGDQWDEVDRLFRGGR